MIGVMILEDKTKLDKLLLINVNAMLFEKAVKEGYALESFIDSFMYSDTAKILDSPEGYEKYGLEKAEVLWGDFMDECFSQGRQLTKADNFEKSVPAYMSEIGFWCGYVYRSWHFAQGLSSHEMADLIPASYMICEYSWGHTMLVDEWIENCAPRVIALVNEEKLTKLTPDR